MKIDSESERIHQTEQAKTLKTGNSSDSSISGLFGDIFNEELTNVTTNNEIDTTDVAQTQASALNIISDAKNGTEISTDQAISNTLLTGIDGALNSMSDYAKALQNPSSQGIKQAWNNLSSTTTDINNMRKDYSNLSKDNNNINSMLNELEVMSVTETFKFNRGDYI